MKQILLIVITGFSLNAFSQLPGTEIILFDMKIAGGQVHLSNGKNITNHKGYDNQPSFHPGQPIIYFTSVNDSNRSDLKFYNYNTAQTNNLTVTREREYSPTVTPDGKFISCIIQRDNQAQDLAKYPIEGGKPIVLVWHLTVGYHAWVDNNRVFLFVLGDSLHDNSLHYYDIEKKSDTVVAEKIGRSLHKIPGQEAMSFTQEVANKNFVIKKYDLNNGVIKTIINALPGQDQLCWLQNRTILMSDGTKLFSFTEDAFTEVKDRKWQPVIIDGDASMLKGVTRLATNVENTKLAVVVSE